MEAVGDSALVQPVLATGATPTPSKFSLVVVAAAAVIFAEVAIASARNRRKSRCLTCNRTSLS